MNIIPKEKCCKLNNNYECTAIVCFSEKQCPAVNKKKKKYCLPYNYMHDFGGWLNRYHPEYFLKGG